jgi:hypothetical protein
MRRDRPFWRRLKVRLRQVVEVDGVERPSGWPGPVDGFECERPDGDRQLIPLRLACDLGLISRWGTEHLKDQVVDANGDRVTLQSGSNVTRGAV